MVLKTIFQAKTATELCELSYYVRKIKMTFHNLSIWDDIFIRELHFSGKKREGNIFLS